jgi:hypothetical protein
MKKGVKETLMDTKNFKNLCDRLLKKYGFKKKKTMYYKDSNDGIRCGVYLQRSYYGKVYYFNYYYFLDNSDVKVFPQYFEADVYGRITVLSKIKDWDDNYHQTALIEYELYEEKELEEYLEKGIQDEILLPVKKGRQVIYDMVKSGICIIYKFRSKEEEEVMQKLYDLRTGEGQKS